MEALKDWSMVSCWVQELSLKSISLACIVSRDHAVTHGDVSYVHLCLYHPDPHSSSWD